MEDTANAGNTSVESGSGNATPAKKTTTKSKSAKASKSKSSHPPTSEMVSTAIKELKDRKGSSLQAIKKYIASTYKVDGEKLAPFIKRYLKSAVTSGAVVQTKGKGASGSFKLPVAKGSETKSKVTRTVKVAEAKKPKKSVEKKTTALRKPAAAKKAPASPAKKTEAAKKPATPKKSPAKAEKLAKAEKTKASPDARTMSRSKKTAKSPATRTKAPKPKKAAAPRAVKASPKK